MNSEVPEAAQFLDMLRRDGHVRDSQARLTPLSGGVSSELYLVEDGAEKFVVKRALPKLKVKDNWFADVSRNSTEWKYLDYVGALMPGVVPKLRFSNPDAGYFGMEFLGEGFANWKQLLLAGECRTEHAALAGKILGDIHRRTSFNITLWKQFDTTPNFHQLRVEPYLLTTGNRNPKLRDLLSAEAERIESTHEVLVHGDFSPKNILISGDRMVLLDCEVAWYGEPAFDVAFCLNHLLLKSLHHAPRRFGIESLIAAFWQAYAEGRRSGKSSFVERRLVPLLLMLLLARVDGKSPVEYLTLGKQRFIRDFVHEHLPSPPRNLARLSEIWFAELFSASHFMDTA
ncbi:MAG: aminoglycoside phosphotransferase family protein [Bryobacteraceae bacterium]